MMTGKCLFLKQYKYQVVLQHSSSGARSDGSNNPVYCGQGIFRYLRCCPFAHVFFVSVL